MFCNALQVDMTLTKKELMAAVKLCSDVSVQRGLPNMRIRPKSHVHHHIRAPFHAHQKRQQIIKAVSSSTPYKENTAPQKMVQVPIKSRGDILNISVIYAQVISL